MVSSKDGEKTLDSDSVYYKEPWQDFGWSVNQTWKNNVLDPCYSNGSHGPATWFSPASVDVSFIHGPTQDLPNIRWLVIAVCVNT